MEFKKYSLAGLSVFLILLVFVGSASAADTNEADVLSTIDESVMENNLLSIDNNVECNGNVLKENEGTYSELRDEISSGGDKTLNKTFYKYDGSSEVITISQSGTIDGNGAVIDMAGSNMGTFFITSDVDVVIKNLVIKNSKCDSGAAIYSNGGGSVVNCTFVNNTASDAGGAIFLTKNGNITDCTFVNNSVFGDATSGGAIAFVSGHSTLSNCLFVNNMAMLGGAIFSGDYLDDNCVEVSNCTFVNNTAFDVGGAIYSVYSIKASSSVFVNNTASILGNDLHMQGEIGDCWFGSNNPDWSKSIDNSGYVPSSYVILNATATPVTSTNSSVMLKYAFYKSSTGDAMSDMPIRPIELSSDAGFLENTSGYLINGEFSTKFTSNTPGVHKITAKVDNEEITLNINVTLTPTRISVNATSLNLTVGYTDIIGANLTPSEAGNVSFNSSDENIVTVDENGVVTAVAEGKATIIAWFGGDDTYAADNVSISVIVNEDLIRNVTVENVIKYFSGPEALVVNVTNSKGKPVCGELVLITIDGITYNKTTDKDGLASLNLTLNPGNYTVNTTVGNITVNSYAYIITTLVSVSIQSELRTVEYTAWFTDGEGTPLENGTAVKIDIGGKEYKEEISGDEGEVRIDLVLNSGYYTVTVINPKTKEKALSHINITAEDPIMDIEADEITVGENATVTVTLNDDATGNVTIGDEIIPLVNATASAVLTNLPVGNTTVPVTYSGDKYYNSAQANVNVTVNPKSDLDISAIADPILVGEVASVKVTGFENATGNVSVIVNGKTYSAPIKKSEAEVSVEGLTENVTADVIYGGDAKYNNASTAVDIVVYPKADLNISASAEPIAVGEDAIVVVTGFENATGNVSVIVNGKTYYAPIKDGEASVTVFALTENVTADVVYGGDAKYNNASTTVDIVVYPKSDLNISASAEPIYAGEVAVVVVSGFENATGVVFVAVGEDIYTTSIVNGTASVSVPGLAGNVTAEVTYDGDAKYNNASTTVDIVVNPKENATIVIDAPSIVVGQNATVTVALPEDATGSVTVGDEIVPLLNGTASAVLTDLPVGNITLPVTYSGDVKYNPIEANVTVLVKDALIIKASDLTKYYGGSERFVVKVTDYEGNPLVNKTVVININSINYTRHTDENGTASIAIGLHSGTYNVTVTVDNTTAKAVVTVLSTVNGTDIVKMYKNATQYYATFIDSEGKYLADGTAVTFNINGIFYERKISGDKGLAKLNINLPAKDYIITAINPVTGEKEKNNITVLSTITENRNITKYFKNATQYTVQIIGDDGKAVGAGESVTFNINGIFYTRQTNESGIATLNINLPPGDYIITAEYKGCKVSNNIKVLPILTAEDITMKFQDGTQFVATLVDGQGKPYAEQKVQFNINGVFYKRGTDSSGQAKLNINLPVGEYIITSEYNGASIANKITITS